MKSHIHFKKSPQCFFESFFSQNIEMILPYQIDDVDEVIETAGTPNIAGLF